MDETLRLKIAGAANDGQKLGAIAQRFGIEQSQVLEALGIGDPKPLAHAKADGAC